MIYFLSAFCGAAILIPLMARAAERIGWVSPSRNRRERHPAMSGGLSIAIVVAALALVSADLESFRHLSGLWLGFLLAGTVGLIDDSLGLSPLLKFLLQLLAGSTALLCLTLEGDLAIHPLRAAASLLWIVALMNAFNLLDNMDGIAGGVAFISCLTMLLLFLQGGTPEALLLSCLAGALFGFLIYNFSPARVYLGDTGSHLIGFTLSVVAIRIAAAHDFAVNVQLALITVVLVPLLDTVFVVVRRSTEGRPFYRGGKDHLSHWLLARGLSERGVAVVFYALAAGCSVLAAGTFLLLGE